MNDMGPNYAEAFAREWSRRLENRQWFYNTPEATAERERRAREWKARPWWDRAWVRISVWFYNKRERLGEIIAGRRFED
jgi:hypothetical protein